MSKPQIKTKILVLAGVSCAGKTTIADMLVKNGWGRLKTTTSRARRPEEPLDAYNFVTKEEFNALIEQHKLIEFDKYAGNYYGVQKQEINAAIRDGGNYVVILTHPGVKAVKSYGPAKRRDVIVRSVLVSISTEQFRRRITQRQLDACKVSDWAASRRVVEDSINRIFTYFMRDLPWMIGEKLKHALHLGVYDSIMESSSSRTYIPAQAIHLDPSLFP